ncbi:MAG: flavodoxin family protein [Deltaproteobacteria bacterium]|nr:flavodoxin family protein [Deltaproteobacteria bacterium]
MKTLIVYSSKSGNTRKLAEAVYDFLPGENFLRTVEEKPDSSGYDFIVVGFWLQGGKADPESLEYLATIAPGNLFLFATHGASASSQHVQKAIQEAKELVSSSKVLGTFNCQGEVKKEFLAKVQQKDPQPPWVKDAPGAVGHPDGSDIANLQSELERAVTMLRAEK